MSKGQLGGDDWVQPSTRMTTEEQNLAIRMYFKEQIAMKEIAYKLGRNVNTIQRLIRRFAGTTEMAEQLFRAKALDLAKKVVKHATVEEAMEVLSRPNIGVLQPAKSTVGGPQILVSFGPDSIGGIEARPGGSVSISGSVGGGELPPASDRAKLIGTGATQDEVQREPENRDEAPEAPPRVLGPSHESAKRPQTVAATPDRRPRAQRDTRATQEKVSRAAGPPIRLVGSRPVPSTNRSKINLSYDIVEDD